MHTGFDVFLTEFEECVVKIITIFLILYIVLKTIF
jgi:hypothetical protein